jgi:hypothetical protein
LTDPTNILTAPNGDIFLAEMEPGRIRIFRGMTADGKSNTKSRQNSGHSSGR